VFQEHTNPGVPSSGSGVTLPSGDLFPGGAFQEDLVADLIARADYRRREASAGAGWCLLRVPHTTDYISVTYPGMRYTMRYWQYRI